MTSLNNTWHEKTPHLLWAIFLAALCISAISWKNDLIKDAATTLGTTGFFATIYGLIFAIIELQRTKNATLLVQEEVARVLNRVKVVDSAQEITECLNKTSLALSSIDEGKMITNALLGQIISDYSQIFQVELIDAASDHRQVRSTIQSYTFVAEEGKIPRFPRKTREALLVIKGQLGERQASNRNFTENT